MNKKAEIINQRSEPNKIRAGDYIIYQLDRKHYKGKVMDIKDGNAKIEIYTRWNRTDEPFIEVIDNVDLNEIRKMY